MLERSSGPARVRAGQPGRVVVGLALVAFIGLGLPDGVLGVAWPSMRRSFRVPIESLGPLLAASMLGYLASSAASGTLVARLGVGRLLVTACLGMAGSAMTQALAPAWPVVVLAGLVGGLGAGAVDAGLNAFAAARFSPRFTSWLHASYGLGAALGPLMTSAVLAAGAPWRAAYGVVALALAGMAAGFAGAAGRFVSPQGSRPSARAESVTLVATVRDPGVRLGMLVFFVYAGLEVGVGQWTYSWLVEGRGVGPGQAAAWVSAYWASITAGRFALGAATGWVPLGLVLRASLAAVPLGVAILAGGWGPTAGALGLPLVGLALAPIFPILIATTPDRVGASLTPHAIGAQVAAFYLGTAVLPWIAGLLARWAGLESLGPFLLATALALAVVYGAAARRGTIRPAVGARRGSAWRREARR